MAQSRRGEVRCEGKACPAPGGRILFQQVGGLAVSTHRDKPMALLGLVMAQCPECNALWQSKEIALGRAEPPSAGRAPVAQPCANPRCDEILFERAGGLCISRHGGRRLAALNVLTMTCAKCGWTWSDPGFEAIAAEVFDQAKQQGFRVVGHTPPPTEARLAA